MCICVCVQGCWLLRGEEGGWTHLQWFQVRSKILAASLKEQDGKMWETFRLDPQKNLFIEQIGTKPNRKKERFQKKQHLTFFWFCWSLIIIYDWISIFTSLKKQEDRIFYRLNSKFKVEVLVWIKRVNWCLKAVKNKTTLQQHHFLLLDFTKKELFLFM